MQVAQLYQEGSINREPNAIQNPYYFSLILYKALHHTIAMLFKSVLASALLVLVSAQNNGALDEFSQNTGTAQSQAQNSEEETTVNQETTTLAQSTNATPTSAETAETQISNTNPTETPATAETATETETNTNPTITAQTTPETSQETGETTVWWTPETTQWWTPDTSNTWWTPSTSADSSTSSPSESSNIILSTFTSGSVVQEVTLSLSNSVYYTIENYTNSTNNAGALVKENGLQKVVIPIVLGGALLLI